MLTHAVVTWQLHGGYTMGTQWGLATHSLRSMEVKVYALPEKLPVGFVTMWRSNDFDVMPELPAPEAHADAPPPERQRGTGGAEGAATGPSR